MSPYFPKDAVRAYWCPNCLGWFLPSPTRCLAFHAPGACCHEYEQRVEHPRAAGGPSHD